MFFFHDSTYYYQVPLNKASQAKIFCHFFQDFSVQFHAFWFKKCGCHFSKVDGSNFWRFGFFFVYLDDILISSETEEEHRKHLQEVFRLLQRAGLTINLPKSEFFAKELEFLSQCQQNNAVAQAHSMVKDYHVPRRKDEVSKFLGLLNFSAPSCLYPIEDSSSCQQLA